MEDKLVLTEKQKLFIVESRKTSSWRMVAQLFAKKYGIIEPVIEGTDHYSQLDGMMLCDLAGVIEESD